MTSWIDQKNVEIQIISCESWQSVLDELEKPGAQFTTSHVSSILKGIADECMRIEEETVAIAGQSPDFGFSTGEIIAVACEVAVKTIRGKSA